MKDLLMIFMCSVLLLVVFYPAVIIHSAFGLLGIYAYALLLSILIMKYEIK